MSSIDLRKCRLGDVLRLGTDELVTYLRYQPDCRYPHVMAFQNGVESTWTNDGCVYDYEKNPKDVVEIVISGETEEFNNWMIGMIEFVKSIARCPNCEGIYSCKPECQRHKDSQFFMSDTNCEKYDQMIDARNALNKSDTNCKKYDQMVAARNALNKPEEKK